MADGRVRMLVTGLQYVHATWKIGGHDIATSLIEDWLVDARVRGAKSFPIPECRIAGRYVAVSNSH
jgi:hypothetical protein